jgi:glycine/D-amino acid oxidase-like deaminating enzyme
MTKYGRSPWTDQFSKSRIPSYPKHRGALQVDVVVIGGGLTGCLTAYATAAAGLKTMLLEGDRIGVGTTAAASGWIADDPGVPLPLLEKAAGARNARRAVQAWRRAALDFAALLRRLDVKCQLQPAECVTVGLTSEQGARLLKDQKARKAAGLQASVLSAAAIKTEVGLDAATAFRSRDGATLDPYGACVGIAAAADSRGARLFERSPVKKITFTRKDATVITDGGSIRTRRIAVATGLPSGLFQSLARHFWFRSTYLAQTGPIPAKVRARLGSRQSAIRDSAEPPHFIRWVGGDRLLVSGADGETGTARLRDKLVVQRTGQLMYELSTLYPDVSGIQPEYGWIADYARTVDGLPYIGAHRNFPHHVFAFGNSSGSVTGAYLASRIMLRNCSGEMDPADEVFGFHR